MYCTFLKSNSRPNRGIFVIMFMLGKATGKIKLIKVGVVLGPGLKTFFSISREDEPQESSYGGTLIVVCFKVLKAKIGNGYRS